MNFLIWPLMLPLPRLSPPTLKLPGPRLKLPPLCPRPLCWCDICALFAEVGFAVVASAFAVLVLVVSTLVIAVVAVVAAGVVTRATLAGVIATVLEVLGAGCGAGSVTTDVPLAEVVVVGVAAVEYELFVARLAGTSSLRGGSAGISICGASTVATAGAGATGAGVTGAVTWESAPDAARSGWLRLPRCRGSGRG